MNETDALRRIRELERQLGQKDALLGQKDALLGQKDALLGQKDALLGQKDAVIEQQNALLSEQKSQYEQLRLEFDAFVQHIFARRSERYIHDPRQLSLDLGDSDEAVDVTAGLTQAIAEREAFNEGDDQAGSLPESRRQGKLSVKARRNEHLPPNLPRYEVTAETPDDVKTCPTHGERELIGYDRVETLEYTRPKLRVRVTLYPKYACPAAAGCGVAQPPREPGLVEGNRYHTSVAAEIITAKYGYYLPIYRQQDLFASSGWTPSRGTLLNILVACGQLIRPFCQYLADCVRGDPVLGTDDTGVTLLLPRAIPKLIEGDPRSARIHEVFTLARNENKPSVRAKMWVYRGVTIPLNIFDFTVSRHRDGPDDFLLGGGELACYRGTILADCYSGYTGITLRSDGAIRRAACVAHARRHVFEARLVHPVPVAVLMAMFRELYDIEDRGKSLSPEDRLQLRMSESQAVWQRMRDYLDGPACANVLPKDALSQAIGYLNNQWESLRAYLTDPLVPIDNNAAEQLMREVALGRKNWMFIGSLVAGQRAADFMTLVSSAHRNDLDVSIYIHAVLDALLSGSTDYASLRPDVWAAAHPECIRTYRQAERRDRADRTQRRRAGRRRP